MTMTAHKHIALSLWLAVLSSAPAACEQASTDDGATTQESASALTDDSSLQALGAAPRPSIVLVHGAFADGSGWQYLTPMLQRAGYTVTAVQNPLSSVTDDVAKTRLVLDAQPGDVVLVGHSYGGVVISAAGNHPKVKALVYVAAFAPDDGEILGELNGKFGPSDLGSALSPDAAGYLYIDRAKYPDVFAGDVLKPIARAMATAQKPLAASVFAAPASHAAWHELPSWYVVSRQDHAIRPELERFMAARMGAITTELDASHVSFISRPRQIAKVILEAARSVAP